MTRNRNEILADAATLKESGYWRSRSGHTAAEETGKYEAAKARLKNDLKHDPQSVMAVVAGDDDAFERRVDELVKSNP